MMVTDPTLYSNEHCLGKGVKNKKTNWVTPASGSSRVARTGYVQVCMWKVIFLLRDPSINLATEETSSSPPHAFLK